MNNKEFDWEMKMKTSPATRPPESSLVLRQKIVAALENPKKKLTWPISLKVGLSLLLIGIVILFTVNATSPLFKEGLASLTKTKYLMLPGTNDIPLFPGLQKQKETDPYEHYIIRNATLEELLQFYKEKLPLLGWTLEDEGNSTGTGEKGESIIAKVSIWFNESKQRWLRVSLYEHQDGLRSVLLEDHFYIAQAVKVMTSEIAEKEAPQPVKDWLHQQLQKVNSLNAVFNYAGRSYALIRASSEHSTVSFQRVEFDGKNAVVYYQADSQGSSVGKQNYLLIKFNLIYDVELK
jgi:hypothetical protein